MLAWLTVGPHRYYVDGDVVYFRMMGVLEEDHTVQLLAAVDGVLGHSSHVLLLIDGTHAHNLAPEARRRYAEWLRQASNPKRAAIFFRANGEMKAFLALARRGGELLSSNHSGIEIVDDEAAAWQRAADLRAEWAT
jgi:hypothetical protein